jgi:nucleoid-associated protein YgaU
VDADIPDGEEAAEAAHTYVTKAGDTLTGIAEHFYGDASLWPRIHEANKRSSAPTRTTSESTSP